MGKRRRKQNEELDKDNVSLDENKGIKLSKTLSTSNIAVSIEDCTDIKRTKLEKHVYNKDKLDKMPVDNEKDKSNENTSKKTKKKKHKTQEQEIVNIKSYEGKSIDDNKKTRKKRDNKDEVQDLLVNEKKISSESQCVSVKTRKKKQKVDINLNGEDSENIIDVGVSNMDKKQNVNNKKHKKINQRIHEDVVQNEETNNDESKKPKKKRQRKIVEEEVINEEDIDKYCDELDPSYNKQYEDWVKLIESNLSSNKKAKK